MGLLQKNIIAILSHWEISEDTKFCTKTCQKTLRCTKREMCLQMPFNMRRKQLLKNYVKDK